MSPTALNVSPPGATGGNAGDDVLALGVGASLVGVAVVAGDLVDVDAPLIASPSAPSTAATPSTSAVAVTLRAGTEGAAGPPSGLRNGTKVPTPSAVSGSASLFTAARARSGFGTSAPSSNVATPTAVPAATCAGRGFVASRLDLGAAHLKAGLAILSASALLVAITVGAFTVPKQHRQAVARERARATEQVHAATEKAALEQVQRFGQSLGDAVKKHLAAEARRWTVAVREAGLADGRGPEPMPPMKGLMAQDRVRLEGEWRVALEKRIAELRD